MEPAATPSELERRLAAAAVDPAERPAFAAALLAGDVYVLGWLDQPAAGGVAQPGSSMKLTTWSDDEGPVTPFFTSEEALRSALASGPPADGRFLRVTTRDFFVMTRGSRLALNPRGAHGKTYTPAEVEALLAGTEPGVTTEVVETERQVLVGTPAHLPPRLPEVLARYLVQRPGVQAAHLGWIAHPDGRQGYLLVLLADDREAAMKGFGTLQIAELTDGRNFDVVVVPAHSSQHLLSTVPAFYTRKPQTDVQTSARRGFFRRR